MFKLFVVTAALQGVLLLQACSENGFHLRKNIDLPLDYKTLKIANLADDNGFRKALRVAIQEAGGQLLDDSEAKISTVIRFNNFREGKRVVAYTSERKARIYLLYLKLDYQIILWGKPVSEKRRINLDKTFVYDANFALGKAEEEKQIRQELYAEAARLILLRLQYAKK